MREFQSFKIDDIVVVFDTLYMVAKDIPATEEFKYFVFETNNGLDIRLLPTSKGDINQHMFEISIRNSGDSISVKDLAAVTEGKFLFPYYIED